MTSQEKTNYQILARRYRPQVFSEVVGQDAIVTTLKNAIQQNRLAQAYLFCGPRGTGKTTLARIFAKALNCPSKTDAGEPCGTCPSCKEIASGNSLDVLEIDGASHRGIEDIRQINETVTYSPSSGQYKIYLIDEVHMLTKEAFNALLKTLEEPPRHVKFFFATTEAHKILPTILSRCQRYNLQRIPEGKITDKLERICSDLSIEIERPALAQLAARAEGGLRDAESLLDQVMAFHEGAITLNVVCEILGIVPREQFFALDDAGRNRDWPFAFAFAEQVYREGKDVPFFLESLMTHFRHLLYVKMAGGKDDLLPVPADEKKRYVEASKGYTKEQLLLILDDLFETVSQIRVLPTGTLTLEVVLLRILRSHCRIPYDSLISRLEELENKTETAPPSPKQPPIEAKPPPPVIEKKVAPPSRKGPKIIEEKAPPVIESAPAPIELGARPTPETREEEKKKQMRRDTIFEFAAVELGGQLEKKVRKR